MKLNEIFEAASIALSKMAKENPEAGLKHNGAKITYDFLAKELQNTAIWCYKGEVDIIKVIRCKNCENYKLFKKKNNPKSQGCYLCKLDKQKKSPDLYCGYGINKQED